MTGKLSFWDLIAQAAKRSPHISKVQGGGHEVPADGIARARFVGYYEVGKHEEEFQGQKKVRDKVGLVFELSGPNHPPRDANGEKEPQRIAAWENLVLNEKAHFYKLFRQMNYSGKAKHMAELLGEPYLVEIFHSKSKDGKRTYANLRGPNGYNVKGTTVQDPVSGKQFDVPVPPSSTDLKVFLWEFADREAWDSIYIPGEYPEQKDARTGEVIVPAKSKNVLQEKIMAAKNWPEHHLYEDVKARPSVAVYRESAARATTQEQQGETDRELPAAQTARRKAMR
ncbi:hypothetical protein [Paraburkholderia ferrariae]|uniref:hypothetical protein n=1 Tax=Paraburkholderia ferrariae TaxID=386056 RepID=UPI00069453FF|nr:hypothetical protein [Paraburkholderia ferrariae]